MRAALGAPGISGRDAAEGLENWDMADYLTKTNLCTAQKLSAKMWVG
jgi:hypothetical protein